jgi:hypothetical protein
VAADNWHGIIAIFDAKTTRMYILTIGHRTYGRGAHPHMGWNLESKSVEFTSIDVLHTVNEVDSATFAQIAPFQVRLWAVLPRGFLQVSAADRFCDSLHRPAPPARRLELFYNILVGILLMPNPDIIRGNF